MICEKDTVNERCMREDYTHYNLYIPLVGRLLQAFMKSSLASLLLTHWGRDKWRPFRRRHFQCIFLNGNVWIPIKISLKFVPKGPIYNIPTMVQIMAWRRPGNKPLFEPMGVSLPTHICVARPQWVKVFFSYKYRQKTWSSLCLQISLNLTVQTYQYAWWHLSWSCYDNTDIRIELTPHII